jgi:geranylgeranyl pyrophosphate synthase
MSQTPPTPSEQALQVPETRDLREQIRLEVDKLVEQLDRSELIGRDRFETLSKELLENLNLPANYLGWTMVAIGSAFWRDQVAATPYNRRLLLLPHCLRDARQCPARFNEWGLLCRDCGACELSDLKRHAEKLGYQVLLAEGSPAVMQVIIGGHADAMIGVSCLTVLERSLERILPTGIPCMAVPLTKDGCQNTETDLDWVIRMIDTPYRPTTEKTRTYVHLLRCAKQIFEPNKFDWLVPRDKKANSPTPLESTESIGYDFILRGGKRARPFVTLAVYDAITGSEATGPDGERQSAEIPEPVKRVAAAIEIFHKASLVHDDIEDDDPSRYDQPTLHREYSVPIAINVGDFLIGLGYRIVAGQRAQIGAEAVADILAQLAEAHTRLSEGQGAELAWRDGNRKKISPSDALEIYAQKTSPAFEAALYAGLRLAGEAESYRQPIHQFARYLGTAFQVLNDLKNLRQNQGEAVEGSDILGHRPTVLWALALDRLEPEKRSDLETCLADEPLDSKTLAKITSLYREAGIDSQAEHLVDEYHQKARQVADEIEPTALRHLLNYLADSILDR